MNAIPERRFGDFLLIFALLFVVAFVIAAPVLLGLVMWAKKYEIPDAERLLGFALQAVLNQIETPSQSALFQAPPIYQWTGDFLRLAENTNTFSFMVSAALSGWLSLSATNPPQPTRQISGRRVTKNPAEIQRDLEKQGDADGIKIHPKVTISRARERQHMLVFGQPGAGKTQILMPIMAYAVNRGDRVLTFDYKGDFTETTGERLQIFAPWDARSWAWDISHDVLNKMDARTFAAGLIQENDKDPFWSNGARSLLVAMLVKLQAEKGEGNWGWRDLADLIPAEFDKLQQIVLQYNVEGAAFVEEASKTTTSLRATLAAFMAPVFDMADAWENAPVEKQISIRRWLIDPPAHYPRGLILGGNLAYETLMKSFIQGILRVILQVVGDPRFSTKDHGIWGFLDEFRQLGKIEPLLQLLEVSRGKGIRFVLAAQDQASLAETYSTDVARAMLGTVGTIIFGRTIGPSAADYSEQLGDIEVDRYTVTQSSSIGGKGVNTGQATSYQRDKRPAFRADQFGTELGQFRVGGKWVSRALLFTGGDCLGVLDWPRTIWPQQREPVVLADWLAPGWPHRSAAYLAGPAAGNGGEQKEEKTPGQAGRDTTVAAIDGRDNTPAEQIQLQTLKLVQTPEVDRESPAEGAEAVQDFSEAVEELSEVDTLAEAILPGIDAAKSAAEIYDLMLPPVANVTPVASVETVDVEHEDEEKKRRQQRRQQEIAAARAIDEQEPER